MKKIMLLYGAVVLLLFLAFLASPRFGWYIEDNYGHSEILHYAGFEKKSEKENSKRIHYKGKQAEVTITGILDTEGYQIDYRNEELEVADSWVWKDYDGFREAYSKVPFTIQSIGERLYQQDKQARGISLFLAVIGTGVLSILAAWGWQQGRRQERAMKRDLCLICLVLLTVLYAGTCLRIFTWSWLSLFF